jgi:hypothetical protein
MNPLWDLMGHIRMTSRVGCQHLVSVAPTWGWP